MDNREFWDRAKPLIKATNMTQKQFADYLGISFNTFRNWIQYKRIPDLESANFI
jgi:DNA-binding transcriptional regulator YiaG